MYRNTTDSTLSRQEIKRKVQDIVKTIPGGLGPWPATYVRGAWTPAVNADWLTSSTILVKLNPAGVFLAWPLNFGFPDIYTGLPEV